jgi:acetyltransferase
VDFTLRENTEREKNNLRRQPSTFRTHDGRTLHVRLIRPTDAPLLLDLFDRLSPESRRRRFHAAVDHMPRALVQEEAERLADVDNRTNGGAILALERVREKGQNAERAVAVARLMRPSLDPRSPEVESAIVVRDDYQGQGVAKELLRRSVLLARQMRAGVIVAEIEADNYPAIRAYRGLGLPTESSTSHGETTLRIAVPRE